MRRFIVGITGASGAIYARRVIQGITAAECRVELVASVNGRRLIFDELDMKRLDADALSEGRGELVTIHADNDVGGALGSGSFMHDGMVIVPCSANTLARVSVGVTDNQLQRAACVALKERRPLILAHRESPLSLTEIEAMRTVTLAGAIVLPLAPGFYLKPRSIDDLVDFMAARMLDLLKVPHSLSKRWDEHVADARSERADRASQRA